jgi:NAD(P)-dependent dehydrogenase (short-subunit alcohol dehydrogenase family)
MARKEKGAVVVTGASTGIGRATALRLERDGYRVFAGVRKKADGDDLVKASATGNLTPVMLDVTKARSISAARQKVQRAVGKDGLAGLVNNAGIANAGPVEHLPVAEFEKVLDVNLTGQYAVTQEFLPLIRRATGTIVFITSIGGLIATPFMSPYHAAKFGLEGLADSLRREVRPWGIKVVVVEPGSIATPIWSKGTDAFETIKFPPEAKRLYGTQMEAMKQAIVDTAERGIGPEKVAKVIAKALGKGRPKTRYLVGTDAKVMKRAKGVVGDRNFDKMMRRSMKLPDDAPDAR